MTTTGIILVAGNSTRYRKNINKNFEILGTKMVFEYSLDAFNENANINNIIIVAKKEESNIIENIIFNINILLSILLESVCNALNQTTSDLVIIQDGARPLIKQSFINNLLETILLDNVSGVSVAVKSKDTIKITNNNNFVLSTTNRKASWIVQTPQCFNRKILADCYKKLSNIDSITDDCTILENNNYKVKLIEGDYTNIKITTPEDIYIVSNFIK